MLGDLVSVTNAAGHVTQYLKYDKAGRLLSSKDPNGLITDITYTPRGWVKAVTVTPPVGNGTAQITTYSYDNVGQLTQVQLPNATTMIYTYDTAHRLIGIKDNALNTVSYTLDNLGNRIGEQIKDPGGSLARNVTRVYDALNRLQSVTGAQQ
jgi:YD repeat-containing protein